MYAKRRSLGERRRQRHGRRPMGRAPVGAGTYTNRTQLPRACLPPPPMPMRRNCGIGAEAARTGAGAPALVVSAGRSLPSARCPAVSCVGGALWDRRGAAREGAVCGGCADRAAHTESCVPCALPVRVMCVCACVLPPARLDTLESGSGRVGDYSMCTSGGAIPSFLLSCARGARYVVPGVVELQKGQLFHNGHRPRTDETNNGHRSRTYRTHALRAENSELHRPNGGRCRLEARSVASEPVGESLGLAHLHMG